MNMQQNLANALLELGKRINLNAADAETKELAEEVLLASVYLSDGVFATACNILAGRRHGKDAEHQKTQETTVT